MKRSTLAAIAATLAAFAVSPAWAVNKCTGPNGKVVFQDAPWASASFPDGLLSPPSLAQSRLG
jgi:hypothetical protein